MSMKEDEGATVEPAAMEDDEDDDEMKLALAMSMQQSEAPAPAAAGEFNDPAFGNSMLAQLPGVDPNDPAIHAALGSITLGGAMEDDDARAPAPHTRCAEPPAQPPRHTDGDGLPSQSRSRPSRRPWAGPAINLRKSRGFSNRFV